MPLGAGAEQVPVGLEAADDVLAQLGAVDPDDGAAVTDGPAEGGEAFVDVGAVGAFAQEVGVGAEGVDAEARGAAVEGDGERVVVDGRVQEVLAAGGEGAGPAFGQEAARSAPRMPVRTARATSSGSIR